MAEVTGADFWISGVGTQLDPVGFTVKQCVEDFRGERSNPIAVSLHRIRRRRSGEVFLIGLQDLQADELEAESQKVRLDRRIPAVIGKTPVVVVADLADQVVKTAAELVDGPLQLAPGVVALSDGCLQVALP